MEGGAELGLFPYVGDLRQDRINYRVGKLHPGEVILEVNHKRVPGMIKKDVIALIKRSADPVSLVTVKQSESLPSIPLPFPPLPVIVIAPAIKIAFRSIAFEYKLSVLCVGK